MDPILSWGLEFIGLVQRTFGSGAKPLFETITSLGNEQFFLLLFPLLFWSVDYRLAARLVALSLSSAYLNTIAKDLLIQPRPGDLDASLALIEAYGYGLPSGHAQTAVVVWGFLASWARSGWAWAAGAVLAFLIGLSRVYLGAHFPTDVLGGWLIGAVILWLYINRGARLERWLRGLETYQQILLGVGGALVLFSLHPVNDVVAAMGALAGFAGGLPITLRNGGYSTQGPISQRLLRFVLGSVLVFAFFIGLQVWFPAEGEGLYTPLRFIRYMSMGLMISLGAPWIFRRIGLAPGRTGHAT